MNVLGPCGSAGRQIPEHSYALLRGYRLQTVRGVGRVAVKAEILHALDALGYRLVLAVPAHYWTGVASTLTSLVEGLLAGFTQGLLALDT